MNLSLRQVFKIGFENSKESGCINGDSAGMLAYKEINDSYTFSNAICLLVFLITGKTGEFFP